MKIPAYLFVIVVAARLLDGALCSIAVTAETAISPQTTPSDDAGAVTALEALSARLVKDYRGVVRSVEMSGPEITDAAMVHLKGLPNLEWIRIMDCSVGDQGLANLAGITGLRRVYLRGVAVSDEGLAHLTPLEGLEALALEETRVTGAGLKHLKDMHDLRVVNLGGTAIGTGLAAPRQFIFRSTEHLREITGLGLARAENLVEATQNTDAFVEVSGILKAMATNLLKVATDLRFLSSGPDAGIGEIALPARQAGSSIMPGKVNPVIPEAVSQAAMVTMANDQIIALASSMGHLELNAFVPLIAEALLGSLDLLANASIIFRRLCVEGIAADEQRCRRSVENSTAAVTALVERIGYEVAQSVAQTARRENRGIREVAVERGVLSEQEFDELVSPEHVTRLGSVMRKREEP